MLKLLVTVGMAGTLGAAAVVARGGDRAPLDPTPVAADTTDPVQLYPNNYKVLIENDRVRVLDFVLRRGDTERLHSHPAHVLYVLAPLKIRFTLGDGRVAMREAKPGDVLYSDAVMHSPVNVGENDAHGILVELKGGAGHGMDGMGSMAGRPEHLTAITFINGLLGREAELERELRALTGPTRAEAGNFAYDLYQSTKEPNKFVRFEVWKDEAALEAHKRTPHLRASFTKRQEQGWTTDITLWRRVE